MFDRYVMVAIGFGMGLVMLSSMYQP